MTTFGAAAGAVGTGGHHGSESAKVFSYFSLKIRPGSACRMSVILGFSHHFASSERFPSHRIAIDTVGCATIGCTTLGGCTILGYLTIGANRYNHNASQTNRYLQSGWPHLRQNDGLVDYQTTGNF